MNVDIVGYRPPALLSSFVECFWEGNFNLNRSALFTQRVVPNGYVELVIHSRTSKCYLFKDGAWSASPDYTIIGMHTEPYIVRFDDLVQVFGIRFKPEGIYNIFGVPPSKFKATYENIGDVLGKDFGHFCEQVSDTAHISEKTDHAINYLHRRSEQNVACISYVSRAAEIIRSRNGSIQIDELSDMACISPRQLERGFAEIIGVSPKFYMRITRLNAVQRALEKQNLNLSLTGISHYFGFSDQAHFIREFKTFTGQPPRGFIKRRNEFIVNA